MLVLGGPHQLIVSDPGGYRLLTGSGARLDVDPLSGIHRDGDTIAYVTETGGRQTIILAAAGGP